MTDHERKVRGHVRAFLMLASRSELETELAISIELGDDLRARFVRELIDEIEEPGPAPSGWDAIEA